MAADDAESVDRIKRPPKPSESAKRRAAAVESSPPSPPARDASLHTQRVRRREIANNEREQRIAMQRAFGITAFVFVSVWTVGVYFLVCACADKNDYYHLSDAVLITLLTTTTATVFGLLVIVFHYLFAVPKD